MLKKRFSLWNTCNRVLFLGVLLAIPSYASILGSAANFAILAGTTITNTGNSVITGNIGVSPGTAITGFPPGIVIGTIDSNDTAAMQGEADLATAYNTLAGMASTTTAATTHLGGLVLTQGVYKYTSAADLTGALTLSGPGMFVFQIASGLVIANNAQIFTIGGADPYSIYFQIGSSATVGTGAMLEGNFVALQSISLATGSTLEGRALAVNAAVTLQGNAISIQGSPIPEPGTLMLSGIPMISALSWISRRRKRRCKSFSEQKRLA